MLRRLTRRHCRLLGRRALRRCVRSVAGRCRRPDELAQALVAFRRAITCHRRLARLAPEFFDTTTVNRAAQFREEQRRWMASWKPALDRVYGPDSAGTRALEREPDLPRLPGPRTQRAVERELAGWEFWLAAARTAMDLFRQRRPHALPTFNQLACLIGTAFELGRLAVGDPIEPLEPLAVREERVMADLRRAYGHRVQGDSDCESPSAPGPAQATGWLESALSAPSPANPALASSNVSHLPVVVTSPPPSIRTGADQDRCDAWSRWARQLRRARK